MKFKILPMLLALSVLPASTVWADDEIETGQVVISASRIEQAIEDVPANIDVITAEDIQKMGMTDVTSLLNSQAGLSVSNSSISIRGMGDYTLILINGRKPSEVAETTKDGLDHFLNTLNIYDIERIEIIKGAASTMYGADAMGGVINIITKKSSIPQGTFNASLSNSQFSNSLTFDSGIQGKFSARATSSITRGLGNEYNVMDYDTTDGSYSYGDAYNERTIDTSVTGGVTLGYYHNDDHSVLANYTYSKEYQETSTTDMIFQNSSIDYQGSIGGHNYSVVPSFTSTDHTSARGESIANEYGFKDFNFDIMDTFALNDWNLFTVGALYTNSRVNSTVIDGVQDVYGSSEILTDETMNKIGAFIQDEILLLNEKLIVLSSVRFDYSNFSTPQFTARIGTTYEFMPNQRLKVNFGQAYKTPTLTQLSGIEQQSEKSYTYTQDYIDENWGGVDMGGNEVTLTTSNASSILDEDDNPTLIYLRSKLNVGNPDLEPEMAYTLDGRYEGSFGPFTASLGGYFTVKENAIGSDADYSGVVLYNGTYRLVTYRANSEKTLYYKGLEAELGYTLNEYLTANLSYALISNTDIDGYRQGGYSKHGLTYYLGFTYPDWDVFANIWGKFNIDYQNNADTATTDNSLANYNYFNTDISIGKVFKDKHTIVLSANNILQSAYLYNYKNASNVDTWAINSDWSYPTYKLTFTTIF